MKVLAFVLLFITAFICLTFAAELELGNIDIDSTENEIQPIEAQNFCLSRTTQVCRDGAVGCARLISYVSYVLAHALVNTIIVIVCVIVAFLILLMSLYS